MGQRTSSQQYSDDIVDARPCEVEDNSPIERLGEVHHDNDTLQRGTHENHIGGTLSYFRAFVHVYADRCLSESCCIISAVTTECDNTVLLG